MFNNFVKLGTIFPLYLVQIRVDMFSVFYKFKSPVFFLIGL